MKTSAKLLSLALFASLSGTAVAESKDAGHGKDYRTFHTSGEVEFGSIGDSYTADLVMYLAGNQFMVMQELITEARSSRTSCSSRVKSRARRRR
jgi:hypothetical protein